MPLELKESNLVTVGQTEKTQVQSRLTRKLDRYGLPYNPHRPSLPDELVEFFFLRRYPVVARASAIEVEALADRLLENKKGLNETVTNYLTGLGHEGLFDDSNPSYSDSYPIAQDYIRLTAHRLSLQEGKQSNEEWSENDEHNRNLFLWALTFEYLRPLNYRMPSPLAEILECVYPEESSIGKTQKNLRYPLDLLDQTLGHFTAATWNNYPDDERKVVEAVGSHYIPSGEIKVLPETPFILGLKLKIRAAMMGGMVGLMSTPYAENLNLPLKMASLLTALSMCAYFWKKQDQIVQEISAAVQHARDSGYRQLVLTHETLHSLSTSDIGDIKTDHWYGKSGLRRFRKSDEKNWKEIED